MYVSLDEACTHVDAAAFRLVAGVYNRQGTRLLATAVSPPPSRMCNLLARNPFAHNRRCGNRPRCTTVLRAGASGRPP
jgi:hypothetical protein